ncbi:MAG: hypothetical protein V4692_00235, partial [Bdellovibrionota bacterium]
MIALGRHDEIIPIQIDTVGHVETDLQFNQQYRDGFMPVGLKNSRTYLHDIIFHYIGNVLMRGDILSSTRVRTGLTLEFIEFLRVRASDQPIISRNIDRIQQALATHNDFFGNWVPFMDGALHQERMLPEAATLLLTAVVSSSDAEYMQEIVSYAYRTVPGSHFDYLPANTPKRLRLGEKMNDEYPSTETHRSTGVYALSLIKPILLEFV